MERIFCERLKELRGGMSQRDFAIKIGANQQTYSNWEAGRKDPASSVLPSIATTMGVSIDWLLGLSDRRELGGEAAPILPRAAPAAAWRIIVVKIIISII